MEKLFFRKGPMRTALFMSSKGTNAQKIIEHFLAERKSQMPSYVPVFIFTDNPDSSAVRIGTKDYLDQGFTVPVVVNSFKGFFSSLEADDLKDEYMRETYDSQQLGLLLNYDIDCVALAGYDWIVTPTICKRVLTVNVHPGDLRVRKPNGKPAYAGLAWEPSAKAVLSGENNVYTSVHIVDEEVDTGTVLAVSEPVPVPDDVKSLEDRAVLLGEAKSVRDISHFIRGSPPAESEEQKKIKEEELRRKFPIYGIAKDLQERLKVVGDWVVYPRVLRDIARGGYEQDDAGRIYLDGKPVVK